MKPVAGTPMCEWELEPGKSAPLFLTGGGLAGRIDAANLILFGHMMIASPAGGFSAR
jgi:hypothetical protein